MTRARWGGVLVLAGALLCGAGADTAAVAQALVKGSPFQSKPVKGDTDGSPASGSVQAAEPQQDVPAKGTAAPALRFDPGATGKAATGQRQASPAKGAAGPDKPVSAAGNTAGEQATPGKEVGAAPGSFGTAADAGAGSSPETPVPGPVTGGPNTGAGFTTAPTTGLTEVSGRVRGVDGASRGAVPVAFWPRADGWATPRGAVTVQASETARYRVLLPDGAWLGTACGSPTGYAPLFWEVVTAAGEVVSYREWSDRMPEITRAEIAATGSRGTAWPGDPVTLEGEGFGCSGSVVVSQNGQEVARVDTFGVRTDGRVTFSLPAGEWTAGVPLGFAYRHGRWRSRPAVTGVLPEIPPSSSAAQRNPGSNHSVKGNKR